MNLVLAPHVTRYARAALVCSPDHLASSAGVAALRAGGTAADAAIAANAVLAVTAQHQCGLGGDLFALVHAPQERAPAALNASGRAGSGADPERLRAEGHGRMPRTGDIRAVPVPGCADGWAALHARFGRLPLADVLEPARAYAEDGFPTSPSLAAAGAQLAGVAHADDFLAEGPPRPGRLLRRPGLARTLSSIAAEGRGGFYEGEFGEELVALGQGEYVAADLRRVNADWVEPLAAETWARRVWTVPPNSQGYIALAAAWIAAGLELPGDPTDGGWAHLLVEAVAQSGYDRDEVLFDGADGTALVAPDRLTARRAAIDPERAGGRRGPVTAGGTAYLCAVDAEGMAVSLIQSNFEGFGSLLVLPGTGIFLQNRGAGFSLEAGHPGEYAPGRRPPHTLSPLLVTGSDGSLDAVVGTAGGDSQPQILLQLLARMYAAGELPGEALAAPRWILAEGGVLIEDSAPPDWFSGLEARGHRVQRRPAWSREFGLAHVIVAGEGQLAGAADPRSLGGSACGY